MGFGDGVTLTFVCGCVSLEAFRETVELQPARKTPSAKSEIRE